MSPHIRSRFGRKKRDDRLEELRTNLLATLTRKGLNQHERERTVRIIIDFYEKASDLPRRKRSIRTARFFETTSFYFTRGFSLENVLHKLSLEYGLNYIIPTALPPLTIPSQAPVMRGITRERKNKPIPEPRPQKKPLIVVNRKTVEARMLNYFYKKRKSKWNTEDQITAQNRARVLAHFFMDVYDMHLSQEKNSPKALQHTIDFLAKRNEHAKPANFPQYSAEAYRELTSFYQSLLEQHTDRASRVESTSHFRKNILPEARRHGYRRVR